MASALSIEADWNSLFVDGNEVTEKKWISVQHERREHPTQGVRS